VAIGGKESRHSFDGENHAIYNRDCKKTSIKSFANNEEGSPSS